MGKSAVEVATGEQITGVQINSSGIQITKRTLSDEERSERAGELAVDTVIPVKPFFVARRPRSSQGRALRVLAALAALTAPRLRTEPENGDAGERLRRGSDKRADYGKTVCYMFSSCAYQAALCSAALKGCPDRRTPKATCTILRIMAQMMTFGAFPFEARRALNARPHSVLLTATIAGM
jgi:hypothetical protein